MKTTVTSLARAIHANITPDLAKQVLETATTADRTPEQIADAIVDAIDAFIPWAMIVPGWGALIEAGDGPAIKLIVHGILRLHINAKAKKKGKTKKAKKVEGAEVAPG